MSAHNAPVGNGEDGRLIADCVVPPNPVFVRQYLRANLFDGDEGGVLTVKISDHLDVLVELAIDLFCTIQEDRLYD